MKLSALLLAGVVALVSQTAPGPRQISVTLREGTNMAAALSPDGRTVLLDLQGSLWSMPVSGGSATRLIEEYLDARQPSWSPDGKRVAFQGYADGVWHIYVMNADGSGVRAITSGAFDDREPSWSRDGSRIAFSSDRSGNYDIFDLDVAAGTVRQLTTNPANDYNPAYSPVNASIAFVTEREDRRGVWAIDAETRSERSLAPAAGVLSAPSWTPDGSKVIYNVIANYRSNLVLDGRELTRDEDVFPFRAQWISATEFLYTADGKVKRRSTTGTAATPIEFTAAVSFTRTPYTPMKRDFDARGAQPVRGITSPVISPDGTQVAFLALGDLWLMPIGGTARRLTDDRFVEMDPTWSPDGRSIAFSSDRDGDMDLWVREISSGAEKKVASGATKASWAPRGNEIAYINSDGALAITGRAQPVHPRGFENGRPSWAPEGWIAVTSLTPYSSRFREGTNQLVLVSTTGAAPRRLNPVQHHSIGTRTGDGPVWSRDGSKMAFVMDGAMHVMPTTAVGDPTAAPRRLSDDLANAPSWAADSRRLLYQTPNGLKLVDVTDNRVTDVPVNLTWQAQPPPDRTVIHAGRMFDGKSAALRSNVDIVLRGNRIEQIVEHRADLHTGQVVDAGADVVMPGMIEMHTHLVADYGERLGRIWLAYGITSVRNPAADGYEMLEQKESINSGKRRGPRIFATGGPFDGSRIYYPGGVPLASGGQLPLELQKTTQLGYDLVKTYVRLDDRLQKQVIDFAHQNGMPVTSHEIYPAVASGADGVEHIRGTSRRGYSPKVTALNRSYQDVADLLIASKMTITPTIGITNRAFGVQVAKDPTRFDDARFKTLFPESVVRDMERLVEQGKTTPQELATVAESNKPMGDLVRRIVKGGGIVVAGTDSPIFPYAILYHAELEMFQDAGLTPFEVLQTATIRAAEALGEGGNLGSIEAGKLADLVIVGASPLEDVKNLRKVRTVIKNGTVHTVDSLMQR